MYSSTNFSVHPYDHYFKLFTRQIIYICLIHFFFLCFVKLLFRLEHISYFPQFSWFSVFFFFFYELDKAITSPELDGKSLCRRGLCVGCACQMYFGGWVDLKWLCEVPGVPWRDSWLDLGQVWVGISMNLWFSGYPGRPAYWGCSLFWPRSPGSHCGGLAGWIEYWDWGPTCPRWRDNVKNNIHWHL